MSQSTKADTSTQVDWVEEYLNRDEIMDAAQKEANLETNYEKWRANKILAAQEAIQAFKFRGTPLSKRDMHGVIQYVELLEEETNSKGANSE